jgi:hypothetical protein
MRGVVANPWRSSGAKASSQRIGDLLCGSS